MEVTIQTEGIFESVLKSYEDGPAYFYFIDEYTGVPIVDKEDGHYPLIIREADDVVKEGFSVNAYWNDSHERRKGNIKFLLRRC